MKRSRGKLLPADRPVFGGGVGANVAANAASIGNIQLPPTPAPTFHGANDLSVFVATAGGAIDQWATILKRITEASREAASLAFPVDWQAGRVSMHVESQRDLGSDINTFLVVTTPIPGMHDLLAGEKAFYNAVRQRLGADYPEQVAVVLQYSQDGV